MDELLIESVREYPFLYDASEPGYHDSKKKDNAWVQISENFDQWTADDCRKKWIALRDSFRKAYRKRRTTSGQAAKQIRPWKFEKVMSFIIPYIAERHQISNLARDSESSNTSYIDADTEVEVDNLEKDSECEPIEDDGTVENSQQVTDDDMISKLNTSHKVSTVASKKKHSAVKNVAVPLQSPPPVAQVLQEYLQARKNKTETIATERSDALSSFFKAMEQTVRTFSLPLQIEIKGIISNLVTDYELRNYNFQNVTSTSSCSPNRLAASASNISCPAPTPHYRYQQPYPVCSNEYPPSSSLNTQQPSNTPSGSGSEPTPHYRYQQPYPVCSNEYPPPSSLNTQQPSNAPSESGSEQLHGIDKPWNNIV
ncbi:transcription factor Adf-1-like [Diabrotica virgifera virgifera]|uniref:MADF domain-containing protein n=1 Tax=Diabrotica virgifera virgifera TaxID=50390 RepID=A0ABM5KH30_DIAVI|nr:transcription factor Adf-1-like [Diabrotica virgifera virgifera]XP_050509512.1 transcription factor Adf-1-like [Diabrotica virgifera virgifera]